MKFYMRLIVLVIMIFQINLVSELVYGQNSANLIGDNIRANSKTQKLDSAVFPGVDWEIGVLPTGVDSSLIDSLVSNSFVNSEKGIGVQSAIIVYKGRIVYERYCKNRSNISVMDSYSVAKSILSAVIGIMVGDSILKVNDLAPVDEWANIDDPRHGITIENLLHMASGLLWFEDGEKSMVTKMIYNPIGASSFAASKPLVNPPGKKFEYSTGTSAILSGIITKKLGNSDAAVNYVYDRLLNPIGMSSTNLLRDATGMWYGGLGANSTSRDFARFGLLFVNNGMWNGKRILPENWVSYCFIPSSANKDYGAHWWRWGNGTLAALGYCGQAIIINPFVETIIVVNSFTGSPDELGISLAGKLITEMGKISANTGKQ
jgi:CubicO group peptidase (beta-lactamase class C family)